MNAITDTNSGIMPIFFPISAATNAYTATGNLASSGGAGVNNQLYMGLSIRDNLGRSIRFTTTSYGDTTRTKKGVIAKI